MRFLSSSKPFGLSLLLLVVGAACSRPSAGGGDAGNDGALQSVATATPPVGSGAALSVQDGGFTLTTVAPGEAQRAHVAKLEGSAGGDALRGAAVQALLAKHFTADGGALTPAGGFDVQSVDLTASGRRAVLVMEAGKASASDARPLLVIADEHEHDRVVWSRERPIGGIMAPVGPVAIAAAPAGRVALAACDPPTNIVALRIFDDDGSPFADFQALSIDGGCDAIALLYWPKRGWIVAVARQQSTRARLVSEDGAGAWGQGLDLGARSRAGRIAPPVLAVDTDDTFVLVQIVQPDGADGAPLHALAFRYDARGTAIWPAAVDLGEVPASAKGSLPRVRLAQTKPGVRVTFPGTPGQEREVDLKPSGDVTPRFRAPR